MRLYMSAIPPACSSAQRMPLAGKNGASGKDLLKAYVLGIEVIVRSRLIVPMYRPRFHSTPVFVQPRRRHRGAAAY